MEGKTCCVTGHRDIPADQVEFVKQALRREVRAALEDGYTRFISGFAEGVDLYFAQIVSEIRQENQGLRLEAAIPYRSRLSRLLDDPEAKPLLMACTDIGIHGERYCPSVYMERNRYMISVSDRVIAVYDGRRNGGTATTLHMAHLKKREIREIPVAREQVVRRAAASQ